MQLIFRLTQLTSVAKRNQKLVNQKLRTTAFILDAFLELFLLCIFQVLKEIQSKKELEMVQRIIAQVKAECDATGGDSQRRGYTKH